MEIRKEEIKYIINIFDPVELFPMAPDDEYDVEIKKIFEYLKNSECIQKETLAEYVRKVFMESFGEDTIRIDDDIWLSIANKIINIHSA